MNKIHFIFCVDSDWRWSRVMTVTLTSASSDLNSDRPPLRMNASTLYRRVSTTGTTWCAAMTSRQRHISLRHDISATCLQKANNENVRHRECIILPLNTLHSLISSTDHVTATDCNYALGILYHFMPYPYQISPAASTLGEGWNINLHCYFRRGRHF